MQKKGKIKKEKWGKPILTVLVRGKPEERILTICKNVGLEGEPQAELAQCLITGCGLDCEERAGT